MGTFQKTETVDARQFTGGKENGCELVHWVLSNQGRAMWIDAFKDFPEFINLSVPHDGATPAYVGDWIIWNQDGTFKAMRNESFVASGYVQV